MTGTRARALAARAAVGRGVLAFALLGSFATACDRLGQEECAADDLRCRMERSGDPEVRRLLEPLLEGESATPGESAEGGP